MANDTCRRAAEILLLSAGRTSKATKHLRLVHKIMSDKTEVEQVKKRTRDEDIEHLRSSALYTVNPQRLRLLLETLRVVNNNLPLRSVEYKESRLLEALFVREEMQGVVNYDRVTSSIIELYASTKQEIANVLADARIPGCQNLTMMTDFWTCKTTHRKFLGLRVYFIDTEWQFRSILLGTRLFKPTFGDRDGGIPGPFRAWITQLLQEFEIGTENFFGAMSDAGSDVKTMLRSRLGLQWEWCLAHLCHAATKEACAEVQDPNRDDAYNDMARIMSSIKRTIYQVKSNEKAGDLFEVLCRGRTAGKSVQLLDYNAARFLSLSESIRRILDKWPALVEWYRARVDQAQRQRKAPPVFLLANDHATLVQVLSLLKPITSVKRMAQAEGPNQVDVVLALYMARMHTLDSAKPIKHYLSTRAEPRWIQPHELTPTALALQTRLRDALDSRFFCRYFSTTEMQECSYLFEMQLRLHPTFKRPEASVNRIARLCTRQRGETLSTAQTNAQNVSARVTEKLRVLMMALAGTLGDQTAYEPRPQPLEDEIAEEFAPRVAPPAPENRLRDRVNDELRRWMNDTTPLGRLEEYKESVLSFWRRMEEMGEYRLLPKVARILFCVPTSSAQIERDFGVSGMMVTTQRGSLADHTIDMCSFLNRNRAFVDVEQCREIPNNELARHIPASTIVPLEETTFDENDGDMEGEELDDLIIDYFSRPAEEDDM